MATVISHIYNESYLLPYWLEYHKNIFDHGIIIDYESTDNSLEIVKQFCPSWTIVQSRNKYFEAMEIDKEVMDIENTVTGYKMALNTTEWLFIPDKLVNILKHNCYAMYPIVLSRGDIHEVNNTYDFIRNFTKGIKHHPERGGYRIIHNYNNGQYTTGRHTTTHTYIEYAENMFVIWAGLYPNNKRVLDRKLAIKTKIPISDFNRGFGTSHLYPESRIQEDMNNSIGMDILNDDMYKLAYNYAMKLIGYSYIFNNCDVLYMYKDIEYDHPFIGSYIQDDEQYIKFCVNFDYYIKCTPTFGKNIIPIDTNSPYIKPDSFPIMFLGDIEIHWIHETDEKILMEKYTRRLARLKTPMFIFGDGLFHRENDKKQELIDMFLSIPKHRRIYLHKEDIPEWSNQSYTNRLVNNGWAQPLQWPKADYKHIIENHIKNT